MVDAGALGAEKLVGLFVLSPGAHGRQVVAARQVLDIVSQGGPEAGRLVSQAERGPLRRDHCLSNTTTLWTSLPSAFLPCQVEVRVLPSFDTLLVTVIITLPSFFCCVSIVFASIRFTEMESALATPVVG